MMNFQLLLEFFWFLDLDSRDKQKPVLRKLLAGETHGIIIITTNKLRRIQGKKRERKRERIENCTARVVLQKLQ